jgi:hypothetical protein
MLHRPFYRARSPQSPKKKIEWNKRENPIKKTSSEAYDQKKSKKCVWSGPNYNFPSKPIDHMTPTV